MELPVWTQVEEVLQQTGEILVELSVYRGATLQIRDVSHQSLYIFMLIVYFAVCCNFDMRQLILTIFIACQHTDAPRQHTDARY